MDRFLGIIREFAEESVLGGIFYRYRLGDWKFWFTQQPDGKIFQVQIACDQHRDFELHIDDRNNISAFYPNSYLMSFYGAHFDIMGIQQHIKDCREAQEVLKVIQNFFEHSEHHDLYLKGMVEEEEKQYDCIKLVGAMG